MLVDIIVIENQSKCNFKVYCPSAGSRDVCFLKKKNLSGYFKFLCGLGQCLSTNIGERVQLNMGVCTKGSVSKSEWEHASVRM